MRLENVAENVCGNKCSVLGVYSLECFVVADQRGMFADVEVAVQKHSVLNDLHAVSTANAISEYHGCHRS
ncbi:hypothetical protein HY486_03810 [Candidatus Woesearchaeota archaeon]|nr:hypothetical protein [Candidatus Woesearchaeota archaeon]